MTNTCSNRTLTRGNHLSIGDCVRCIVSKIQLFVWLVTVLSIVTTTKPSKQDLYVASFLLVNGELIEPERIVEYNKRNYSWPLTNFIPNTPGWKQLMTERLAQVERLPTSHERYEGYYRTIRSSLTPNFTQYGVGLGHISKDSNLMITLREAVRDGLPTADVEAYHAAIDSPELPWLIHDKRGLANRVLRELQPHAEAWAGIKLKGWGAYGFRLYRNHSKLHMHLDKMQTHIISFILHIASSEDSEPWPIYIEDFNGTTNEVILTSGDLLFYESSKCFHGRPKRFNGSWYSSIFVHYYPADGWQETNQDLEAHYAVPPQWSQDPPSEGNETVPKLEVAGTSMKEPDCPNEWCRTQNASKWGGPGEEGFWIAPNQERYPLVIVDDGSTNEEL